MAAENGGNEAGLKYGRWATLAIGIATFVVGMALLVSVFNTAKSVFATIDQDLAQVKMASTKNPASASGENEQATNTGEKAVEAKPGGPGLGIVAASIGLKLFGLLIMGWIAALIAARGAGLAAGALCPQKN